ncbi:hypothetical protein RDMS_02505 [Deinococcus sp. RL]|uniref:hypothetical protein n=1 Tax=Deinococcus sp. RL TaxID=1489678 RepID=UPI0004D9D7DF|nr:hypothetical protein [Deinococcus sp. RL]KEF35377.1 hypothetical protein RDMS_02505 [Deinococcus sp. RL]
MLALPADAPLPPNPALVQTVGVAFPGGRVVRVPGPEPMADFPANPTQTLLSPRGDAAAVRFCWDIPKYDSCQVRLVRPGGEVQILTKSDVRHLLWTPDGQYLIGAGANTVRLWNLSGGVRTAVPTPAPAFAPGPSTSRITGLVQAGRDLCVRTEDRWYGKNSRRAGRSVTAIRYALPLLRPLDVTTWPKGKKEADCSAP